MSHVGMHISHLSDTERMGSVARVASGGVRVWCGGGRCSSGGTFSGHHQTHSLTQQLTVNLRSLNSCDTTCRKFNTWAVMMNIVTVLSCLMVSVELPVMSLAIRDNPLETLTNYLRVRTINGCEGDLVNMTCDSDNKVGPEIINSASVM